MHTVILAASTLAILNFSDATDSDGAPSEEVLIADRKVDEVLVLGTRLPTPIDQVGRSVSIVTGEEITERQQHFLADALRITPGVTVTTSGAPGSLANISIRGLPTAQTLVIIDGVEANDPSSFGNTFDFGQFDTADIDRVEVLRGAQSTLYGSNAIGGIINIITNDGRGGLAGSGYLEGGSFGVVRGGGTLRGGTERLSGRLTVAGTESRGFSSAAVFGGDNDGYRNITASTKAGFRPSSTLAFETVVRFSDSRSEFDGGANVDNASNVSNAQSLTVAGSATYAPLEGRLNNRFSVNYFRNARLDFSTFPFEGVGARIALDYLGSARIERHVTLAYGLEYERQDSAVAQGFGGNDAISNVSGYGLLQLTPVRRVTLNAGIRYDANSDFQNATTFSVSGVVRLPVLNALLKGSYAEGFRAPSVGELGFNPALQPENSRSWDVGLSHSFLGERLIVEATYFNADITDQIGFDLSAFNFFNINAYDTEGVELTIRTRPIKPVEITASYTFTDAFNVSGNFAALNQPDHQLSTQIAWRPTDKLSLGAGVRWNGRESNFFGPLDAFAVIDLRASYAVTRNVELFARIENASDTDYQDNFGFNTAPASAFGGLRARY